MKLRLRNLDHYPVVADPRRECPPAGIWRKRKERWKLIDIPPSGLL